MSAYDTGNLAMAFLQHANTENGVVCRRETMELTDGPGQEMTNLLPLTGGHAFPEPRLPLFSTVDHPMDDGEWKSKVMLMTDHPQKDMGQELRRQYPESTPVVSTITNRPSRRAHRSTVCAPIEGDSDVNFDLIHSVPPAPLALTPSDLPNMFEKIGLEIEQGFKTVANEMKRGFRAIDDACDRQISYHVPRLPQFLFRSALQRRRLKSTRRTHSDHGTITQAESVDNVRALSREQAHLTGVQQPIESKGEAFAKSSNSEEDRPYKRTRISDSLCLRKETSDSGGRASTNPPDLVMDCRCGQGPDIEMAGDSINCGFCGCWSHVACQQAKQPELSNFLCEKCLPQLSRERRDWVSLRRKEAELPLCDRLWPGKGVLVKQGVFWYPGRIIKGKKCGMVVEWVVRLWRGNIFPAEASAKAGQLVCVPDSDVIDELWGKASRRRAIRLGRWNLAANLSTDDDILTDVKAVPFTEEIDRALSPHKALLEQLMSNSDAVPEDEVPAKAWLLGAEREAKANRLSKVSKRLKTALIHYEGISVADRAAINNWFHEKIPGASAPGRFVQWFLGLPVAHACTLLLAARIQQERASQGISPGQPTSQFLLGLAWQKQCAVSQGKAHVDVDREAIERLEEQMFEDSQEAGQAGNQQWGLDAGSHQEHWAPYGSLPPMWSTGTREWDETELQRGPDYIDDETDRPRKISKRPVLKPKPRPVALHLVDDNGFQVANDIKKFL